MNRCVVGENATDFQLIWHIFDAFTPWDRKKNDFFLIFPDPCVWHVELLSLSLNANRLRFSCSLRYDTRFGPEATAESFDIVVTLNGIRVNRNTVFDYTFSRETEYLYSFEVEIRDSGESPVPILSILVHMDIKRKGNGGARALNDGAEIQLLFGGESIDMDSLSLALWGSQLYPSYYTLSMFSRENTAFLVHHYILQERWTRLFALHNLDENSNSVNTNIPFLVLSKIVCYMYKGVVDTEGTMWNLPHFVAEFFQVVWRYQIIHLYEALRQSNERVSQIGKSYVDRRRITFALHYVRDTHLDGITVAFPIHVYPYNISNQGPSVHNFLLSVHTKRHNRAGTWLSYSVQSQALTPFNVHISLEIHLNEGSKKIVHTSNYSIPVNGKVASGPVLFLGCPETFRHTVLPEGGESFEALLFGLTFIDETSSANIWHMSKTREHMRNPKEILSQHMRNILERQFKTDLVVQPRGNLNGFGVQSRRIHKEIFNARLPGWRNVVEPRLPEGAALPNVVNLPLTNESFRFVVSYMYTGTTSYIPWSLRPEIDHFAFDSGFVSLRRIISEMRAW